MAPHFGNDHMRSSSFVSTRNGGADYGRMQPYVARLPPLPENVAESPNAFGHLGSQLLEYMESILEGLTRSSTIETVLNECCYYDKHRLHLRRSSDLTGLMSKQKRYWYGTAKARQHEDQSSSTRTAGYHRLKEQMEQYLEEGLARIILENAEDTTDSRVNMAKSWPSWKTFTKQNEFQNTNSIVSTIPIVWVIQPFVRKGKTKFKFSADLGTCFCIGEKELMEFLEIIELFFKSETGSSLCRSTFYQVYTIDSRESRVVRSDAVRSLIEEMTMIASDKGGNGLIESVTSVRQSSNDEDNANRKIYDTRNGKSLFAASPSTTTIAGSTGKDESRKKEGSNPNQSHGPLKRFSRYLNRRRFKRFIRQQAGDNSGESR